jgi:hypothetical protein
VTEGQLIGLAAATLALGLVYWLIGERQRPSGAAREPQT